MDMRWVLSVLIGLPMGLTAAFLAYQAWSAQKQAWAARNWPQTEGTIISAQVKSSRVRVRRGSSGGYRMTTRYEPQVIYRYLANGNSHESKRLYVGDTVGYSGPGPAERILTRYPVGMPVTVYYNPNNPAEATLSPQTGWATTISWLMSAFLFLMTAMVIYAIISNGPIT
ncbi:MAG: DUF3592 domain-containing protein [Chloroflexi bacterium]|nr:DUF3592 domain-containing protein [Chloroflexota bacterium]MBP8059401.1 DUF3592 domain-containing protein [Chloroflexota bacterium]